MFFFHKAKCFFMFQSIIRVCPFRATAAKVPFTDVIHMLSIIKTHDPNECIVKYRYKIFILYSLVCSLNRVLHG